MASELKRTLEQGVSVAILVPRFHPNLLGWVEGLEALDVQVDLLVLRIGALEDRSVGQTSTIPFRSTGVSPNGDPQAFSKWDLPSILWLRRWLRNNRPTYIIVRADPGLFSVACVVACFSVGRRPTFYSQRPMRVPELRLGARILYALARPLHRGWITPVDHLGDASESRPVPGKVFVPFGAGRLPEGGCVDTSLPAPILTIIGKFRSRKRLVEVVRAFGRLEPNVRSHYKLAIAGQCLTDQEAAYFEAVESAIEEMHLDRDCILLPNTSREELLGFIQDSTAVLVPSVDEPASISQIEAIALGVPAVVTRLNGTAHYVSDAGAGLVIGAGEEDLATALRRCTDQETTDRWRKAAVDASGSLHSEAAAVSLLAALRGEPGPRPT